MLPSRADAEVIRLWRNDPTALAMSLTYTEPKSSEEFFPQFLRNYFCDPSLPSLFAIADGVKVGAVRFDPVEETLKGKASEISLIVAPEKRGKGYGGSILEAIEPFLRRRGMGRILARIKKGNLASIKVFSCAGYTLSGEGEILLFEKRVLEKKQDRVFIIAEAGSNWKTGKEGSDLSSALQLIEVAKESGADAVKFQTFKAENVYVPHAGSSEYLSKGGIKEDILDLFRKLEIPREMIVELATHCQRIGIEFMSSVFSLEDLAWIDPYVLRHKIASYEISHLRLLENVAATGKPLILSTGAASVSDIDWAVDVFKKCGGKDLTLMQCTASYPAEAKSIHLNTILWLKNRYQCDVGLSDHSLHPFAAPLGAVAMGASTIEKHFTLSRKLPGPDHFFALEPGELKGMIEAIRSIEVMRGNSIKCVLEEEKELYFFARRGLQALRDIREGEILKEGINMAILRPGRRSLGLHPKYLSQIEGKVALREIREGEGIQLTDIKG